MQLRHDEDVQPQFVPGIELSRRFFEQAVRPIVDETVPDVAYSAARIGSGSEVLGFDTPRSADHEWGPRVQLFFDRSELPVVAEPLDRALAERLPRTFLGWPTNFEPADAPIRQMKLTDGTVAHRVDLVSVEDFAARRLGFDPSVALTRADWLATPWQGLTELTAGTVFHDGLGTLMPLRARLAWYPDDVWRYVLACQWQRVAEQEAFPGRCAEVGDEIGWRVGLARIARDLVRLSLLMDRRYPPYDKWLGTAFAASPNGATLASPVAQALAATSWTQAEQQLSDVYSALARRHNTLGLTEPVEENTRYYFDRPFLVIGAGRFADALLASLTDPFWTQHAGVGTIDQVVDNTAVLTDPSLTRAVRSALDPR